MIGGIVRLALIAALTIAAAETPTAGAQDAERPTVPVSADEVSRGDPASPRIALVVNVGRATRRPRRCSRRCAIEGYGPPSSSWAGGPSATQSYWPHRRRRARGGQPRPFGVRLDVGLRRGCHRRPRVRRRGDLGYHGRTTRPLWSASAGYRDARVLRLAASLGYRPIYLTVDSLDWREGATADGVYQRVMSQTANGAIVVLHFDSPTTTTGTAAVLGQMIDDLRARGYVPGTVTQLLVGD